jgi:hypothetical protein
LPVFIADTSSTTGGGLSGVTSASSGLVLEYRRHGQSTWTSVTAVSKTLGTFTSGGIVADGSLAGAYEVDFPDAAFASSARFVLCRIRGVSNMLPVLIEVELDAVDYQTDAFGALKPTTAGRTLDVSSGGEAGIDLANVGSPTTTLNLSGTTIKAVTDAVTAGTVSDKTGYSLSQAFPTNFASMAITAGGAVTAGTVSDKTGYSLTQAFPSNFSSLAIAAGTGAVTVNGDTFGNTLVITNLATQTSVDTLAGYVDTEVAAIKAKTDLIPADIGSVLVAANVNQRTVSVTGSNHIAADVHEFQPGVITAGDFTAGAIDANALAADAATEIAAAVAATQALSRLDSMIESDGAGQFRFDTIALEQAPAGGGGGTDWTANERTAIRSILGIPGSGTTPTDPTVGILDTIRDKTNLITTGTIASSIPVTASGQIDGPLVIGDDYLSANGRAFIWTVALPSAFVIATSTCKFGMQYQDEEGTYSFNVAGTVTDAGSGNVTLTFDVPKATTGTLGPGWYRWSVEIASASGTEVTRVKSSHNKLVEWVEKQT